MATFPYQIFYDDPANTPQIDNFLISSFEVTANGDLIVFSPTDPSATGGGTIAAYAVGKWKRIKKA